MTGTIGLCSLGSETNWVPAAGVPPIHLWKAPLP
jgi:hypothetical protein